MIEDTDIEDTEAVLTAAAFGDEPGRWPLPEPTDARERWLRAVAAGGQGRYGAALADLETVVRQAPSGPLSALAHSTRGSFLRQLGGHDLARRYDGQALALAGDHPEARADALVGLAADALGVGRFAASAALLDRARSHAPVAPPRLAVRRHWVAAELAMVTGKASVAVENAERAEEFVNQGMVRHRLKSQVVLAGAMCCAGQLDRARGLAEAALDDTDRLGLIPLRWALCCLLADIGSSARTAAELGHLRDGSAALISHRGGTWH